MTIQIQLTSVGEDVGTTFDIYSNIDMNNPLVQNVQLGDILTPAWYTVNNVPDGATFIIITPTDSECPSVPISIVPTTTTTTTAAPTTTTTTTAAVLVYFIGVPNNEGDGANPRDTYWSIAVAGDDAPFDIELFGEEVDYTNAHGQLFVTTDDSPADFDLRAWDAIIGDGEVNPRTVSIIGGQTIYFKVTAGSSPGDYTSMRITINSTTNGVIVNPDQIYISSTT